MLDFWQFQMVPCETLIISNCYWLDIMCDDENAMGKVYTISYVFIGVGALFSLLNIILILANINTMWKNTYARMMLLIQVLYLATCIVDFPHVAYGNYCKVPAALFYFFWMVC